jgi:Na+:H+ antiporter
MELFFILLVLLVTSRLCGEVAERFGQPALVGELAAGLILGALSAHYADALPVLYQLAHSEVFDAINDLAIFFLMLLAGVEMNAGELAAASGGALLVAIGGMAVPFVVGLGVGWLWIPASPVKLAQELFIATALSVTAVPVAVRVLMDLGRLESRVGQTVIAAAIFDDVLSLVLLAILTAIINTGTLPGAVEVILMFVKVMGFFIITGVAAWYLRPKVEQTVRAFISQEPELSILLTVALAYAVLAEILGLHFILGAFLAGLFFMDSKIISREIYDGVKAKLSGITVGFLAPLFFASVGMRFEAGAIWQTPGFVIVLIVTAFAGKIVGAGLPAYWLKFSARQALTLGVAMSARGAVELIIADIAAKAGLFLRPQPVPEIVSGMFSAVIVMAFATTLLTPVMLKPLFRSRSRRRKS